ncbi:sigma-70 family RNA polymerase sigma factor [Haloechinothrix sp. LS1_15]|uniref:sigma-70 family RNA polymerase sigma factor n=1 Tax=Haloechinothrix sp. LS1_15 TaxID=2652248 RepID=UPI0029448115|nr:sigma-70 family RNA polymerase sigma factor [Haloechinothrix sp. LS1_15]MDV6011763.1 sigma-70 family RNA polymerase sigma factor [Haloechinothrix sp. LS1_15]
MITIEQDLVEASRDGDAAAFAELIAPYRRELHAHCYRMTASLDDADDLMQEALLRAWRGLTCFEGRSSFRTWLYRIATNVCLTAIAKQASRMLPAGLPGAASETHDSSPPEMAWISPYPDAVDGAGGELASPEARYEWRESVELAFIAAVQHLSANQRAALLLRDVLGFTAREVADALQTTTTAVNSALQHARRTVQSRVHDPSQQVTLRALGDDRLRSVVAEYMAAFERGDVNAIAAMLAADATWSMPPSSQCYHGVQAIVDFLTRGPIRERWRHRATSANGQLAVGCYLQEADSGIYRATVIDVLTLRGAKILAVTSFADGQLFSRFGLPESLQ